MLCVPGQCSATELRIALLSLFLPVKPKPLSAQLTEHLFCATEHRISRFSERVQQSTNILNLLSVILSSGTT